MKLTMILSVLIFCITSAYAAPNTLLCSGSDGSWKVKVLVKEASPRELVMLQILFSKQATLNGISMSVVKAESSTQGHTIFSFHDQNSTYKLILQDTLSGLGVAELVNNQMNLQIPIECQLLGLN